MATNIQIKRYNGTAWVDYHPKTNASIVAQTPGTSWLTGTTVQANMTAIDSVGVHTGPETVLSPATIVLGGGGHYVAGSTYSITETAPASTSDTDVPTSGAVYTLVQNSLSGLTGALVYKGTVSSNSDLPTTGVQVGWVYVVAKAGTYAGQACEVGDYIICRDVSGSTITWDVLNGENQVTDGNPTLAWGTKSKVATVDGTDIHVTMPGNPNTDSKVSSSNSTSKLFIVGTTSQSASGQAGYSNSGVYISPTQHVVSSGFDAASTNAEEGVTTYGNGDIVRTRGSNTITYTLPSTSGTLALTSQIQNVGSGGLTLARVGAGGTEKLTGFNANSSSAVTYSIAANIIDLGSADPTTSGYKAGDLYFKTL